MSDMSLKLSAYLDGELPQDEASALAARLETDPDLCAEFDALKEANALALADFGAMLQAPVPIALARSIEKIPDPAPVAANLNRRPPLWAAVAASLVLAVIGAGGGFLAGRQSGPVTVARDWVLEIAEYHVLYAAQTRHLAEVPASEAAHIETWLAEQTGVTFRIPDLSAQGLEFQGGRLLSAAGQPVGQLMYLDATGKVIALCFTASDKPATDSPEARNLGGLDVLIWGKPGARFILIGPKDYPGLTAVAETAISV